MKQVFLEHGGRRTRSHHRRRRSRQGRRMLALAMGLWVVAGGAAIALAPWPGKRPPASAAAPPARAQLAVTDGSHPRSAPASSAPPSAAEPSPASTTPTDRSASDPRQQVIDLVNTRPRPGGL